ncbi:MAG: SH3 domain-containing protein [Oculatellaceae cyanobacterium Prado106]|jgi:hypothetical protein|nr:SH3 domain-containing protein [Oculatellaceae cyanobacterium Prado106]
MLSANGGNSLRQAGILNADTQKNSYQDEFKNSRTSKYYSFNLKQKSSLDVSWKNAGANVELIQDRDRDNRVDRDEVITRSRSKSLTRDKLDAGTYYLKVNSISGKDFQFALSATPSATSSRASGFNSWSATQNSASDFIRTAQSSSSGKPSRWNGSFINRNANNVSDFNSYNFSQPAARLDLGSRGRSGKVAAQLKVDFGNDRPARGVQSDNFAMEAWTRVNLKEGRFYRISSDSNDGTRFFFRDRQTGQVLTSMNGDWRDRSTTDATWNSQSVYVPKGGRYDFFVQYYEKSGRSVVNVKLEETEQTGRVVSPTLNLRQSPSTVGNTPIRALNANDTFTVRRQVKSSNDPGVPDWYEVQLRNGTRGYVAAGSDFVELVGGSVALGSSGPINTPPNRGNDAGGGGGFSPSSGALPKEVVVRGNSIGFRNSAGTSASLLGDLSRNTKLTVLDKVSGERYTANGVSYSEWYKVEGTVNGRKQVGYVAAYFVDGEALFNDGRYQSALSKNSTYYSEHFKAANPYKAALEQVAAPYKSWLKPSILAAIGSRESGWGLLLDSQGKGDNGYGHGIMQIDSDFHPNFINTQKWWDPAVNIKYAVENVLVPYYNTLASTTNLKGFDLLRGALAAYNAGPGGVQRAVNNGLDVDAYTTGADYSWDVIQRAGWFQDNGWA